MVSTNLIRLITSAAILAGVNGQVVTTIAITTITLTTFTTVGLSSSPSSTADPSTTTIPSTTPLGVIPITIRTTITILLPGLNRTSSSVAILPAFTSPNNNVTITSVSTVPTVSPPSLITTTTCNFNGTCRVITIPVVIPLSSRATTLTDCYNSICRPVTTFTYPVPPDEFILTRCNFNGTCSTVTRNNTPIATSIPLLSASSSRSSGIRTNTTLAVSSSIRAGTSTLSVTGGPTLVTRSSVNTTNRSSSRSTFSSSRSAAPSSRATAPSSPPLSISRPPSNTPSPPSATTGPVFTSPTAVVVAGEPVLKPFSAMPLMGLLGAVAAGMVFM